MRSITNLYGSDEFVDIVKSCKQNKQTFNVSKINDDDIYSLKPLEELTRNRKKDDDKEQVKWLKMREVMVKKDAPGMLYYK